MATPTTHFALPSKYDEEDYHLVHGVHAPFFDGAAIVGGGGPLDEKSRHLRSRSSPSISEQLIRPFVQDSRSSRTPSIHSEKSRSSSSRGSRRSSVLQPFYIAPRRASLGNGAHEARPPSLMSVAIASTSSFAESFVTQSLVSPTSLLPEGEEGKATTLEPLQEYVDESGHEAGEMDELRSDQAISCDPEGEEGDLDILDSPIFIGQAKRLTIRPDSHGETWLHTGDDVETLDARGAIAICSPKTVSVKPAIHGISQGPTKDDIPLPGTWSVVQEDSTKEMYKCDESEDNALGLAPEASPVSSSLATDSDATSSRPESLTEIKTARLTQDALRRHDSLVGYPGNPLIREHSSTAASIRVRRQSALGIWGAKASPNNVTPIVTRRQGSMNWANDSPKSNEFPDVMEDERHEPRRVSQASDDRSSQTIAGRIASRRESERTTAHLRRTSQDEEDPRSSRMEEKYAETDSPVHERSRSASGQFYDLRAGRRPSGGHEPRQRTESAPTSQHLLCLEFLADSLLERLALSVPQTPQISETDEKPLDTRQIAYKDLSQVDGNTLLTQALVKNDPEKKRTSTWNRFRQRSSGGKIHTSPGQVSDSPPIGKSASPMSVASKGPASPFGDDVKAFKDLDGDEHLTVLAQNLSKMIIVRQHPHAGLKCSYASIGDPTGYPVMVMLGLGVTRWVIGIYDDLASALGLRLICIDRWGIGDTDSIDDHRRSLIGWSAIIDEIASALKIQNYTIMAHSAGAPYAIANAIAFPERVAGSLHLLSPWTSNMEVSQTSLPGYSWTKLVPSQLIGSFVKTEWGSRKHAQKPASAHSNPQSLSSTLMEASANDNLTGSVSDLLLLMKRKPFPPWGFTFEDVASTGHELKIWHGQKDEKIPLRDSFRLLKSIGSQHCQVRTIPNADHSLMLRADVIMEVFESIREEWRARETELQT